MPPGDPRGTGGSPMGARSAFPRVGARSIYVARRCLSERMNNEEKQGVKVGGRAPSMPRERIPGLAEMGPISVACR